MKNNLLTLYSNPKYLIIIFEFFNRVIKYQKTVNNRL